MASSLSILPTGDQERVLDAAQKLQDILTGDASAGVKIQSFGMAQIESLRGTRCADELKKLTVSGGEIDARALVTIQVACKIGGNQAKEAVQGTADLLDAESPSDAIAAVGRLGT